MENENIVAQILLPVAGALTATVVIGFGLSGILLGS